MIQIRIFSCPLQRQESVQVKSSQLAPKAFLGAILWHLMPSMHTTLAPGSYFLLQEKIASAGPPCLFARKRKVFDFDFFLLFSS